MKKILYLVIVILFWTSSLLAQNKKTTSGVKKQQVSESLSIAYSESGTGEEVILLIHGLGSSRLHWQQNLSGLSQKYRTIAVDLPGYGGSKLENVPQDSMLHFFSDNLLAFIDSLDINQVHLVGHSMGGQIAILFAYQHPERVKKLVLVAPAGFETFSEKEAHGIRTFAQNIFPHKISEEQIRKNFSQNFYSMPESAENLIQERIELNESDYYPTYTKVVIKAVEGMLDTPVAEYLTKLKPSVLILFGKEDQLIPNRFLHPQMSTEEVAKKGKEAIPNSELIMIPEAGHLHMVEQPEAFNKTLLNFLNKSN